MINNRYIEKTKILNEIRIFYDWQRELEFKNKKHISILKLFKYIFRL